MAIAVWGLHRVLLRMKLRWRLEDAAFASAKTTLPDIPAQPGSRGPEKVGE
jgi:hypothetical protein